MKIHERDNVEVLLAAQGEIPAGHKVALRDIAEGENIIKYGFPIGHATRPIKAGEWVHCHNLSTNLQGESTYTYNPVPEAKCTLPNIGEETWMGYEREDGRAGIRNELWIIPTVGCVADLANRLANEMARRTTLTVRAFAHNFGCSQLGDDHANTRKVLAALAHHPNAGGVLILGLGCENNQISDLKPLIHSNRVRFMEAQKVEDEMEEGLLALESLAREAENCRRTPQPLSKLCVGLKCGGSDGFSGITANPLLGRLSDLLIAIGASTVLTEVPEMFGAEQLLMDRCRDVQTFEKTVRMINGFKQYFLSQNLPVCENPSPGNKEGGITTLEEKSLGCVQKAGSAIVNDVLDYGDQVRVSGLNLLCAPGNDLVASTALAVAGCQMVLFTTGRGTPFGTCVPTLKVSTNSELAARKPHWIDFNAGIVLEGEEPLEAFLHLVTETASGSASQNEKNGYSSISIWKNGVTL